MLRPGIIIRGKWTGQPLRVERLLGAGANGEVYLVATHQGLAAMKYAQAAADIALEWSILEKLSTDTSVFPKPMFMDDEAGGLGRFFYVMEWVPGETLTKVLPAASEARFGAIALEIVRSIAALHRQGYAFCDVKPENILIMPDSPQAVRFVDVGGVTQFGRAVRQFTPHYDRAYWGLGSRRADPAYDIQGVALLLACSLLSPPLVLQTQTPEARRRWLFRNLQQFPHRTYRDVLQAAVQAQYDSAVALQEALQHAGTWSNTQMRHSKSHTSQHTSVAIARGHDWTEWLMWGSLATAASVTCMAWALMLGWF
ncbi:MAG: phosphotransferase [Alicyclobacillus sp.]|nr:phosphotransferase [Alicyclobacillus sp.]